MMALLLSGCSEEPTKTFWNPAASSLPAPNIQSVTPANTAVAGIDTITIRGTGFSTKLAENYVVFNSQPAQVVSATPTEIRIVAPLLVSDSVVIRAAVQGAFDFSNKMAYQLKPAVAVFGNLSSAVGSVETSTSLTTDKDGSVYTGYSLNGLEAGVLKFSSTGTRTVFAPKVGGDLTGMKIGPGGYLFATRNIRAVYRFALQGGAAPAAWAQVVGASFTDLDFDQSGNLWAGGNNTNIYRFAQDKSVTPFAFTGNIHSMRIYAGYLYFAAKTDAGEKIWRAQITASGLGTPELYFDFASVRPQNIPQAITFSADGDLYIGMNSEEGIMVVSPSKTYVTPLSVYKKLFGKGVKSMAWGTGGIIYCSTVDGVLLKINVTGKTSAPYYGATL
ncbi:MAG: IPT/TIG domain-containing protein [Acidobacteriota bacterium]